MENDKKSPNQVVVALIVFCTIVCIGIVLKVSGAVGAGKAASSDQTKTIAQSRQEDTGGRTGKTRDAGERAEDAGGGAEDGGRAAEGKAGLIAENALPPNRESEPEAGWDSEEYSIHSYRIVTEDCSWEEAFERSLEAGGYLVRINSQEEYEYIIDELNQSGMTKIHFYLGGRRDSGGTDYYWVDEHNRFTDVCLNSSDSWSISEWYENEPSYMDYGVGAYGSDVEENTMNLFCVSDRWYLNDSFDNLPENYPNLLSGKVGYLIEFE